MRFIMTKSGEGLTTDGRGSGKGKRVIWGIREPLISEYRNRTICEVGRIYCRSALEPTPEFVRRLSDRAAELRSSLSRANRRERWRFRARNRRPTVARQAARF